MREIDTAIFEFVRRLKKRPMPKGETRQKRDLKGINPIIELGEVSDLAILQTDETDNSLVSKYVGVDGGEMIGLDETSFSDLKELLAGLLEDPLFAAYADMAFLSEKAFDWLIGVYKSKKAEMNLTSYLKDALDYETKEYHFFLRIMPLAIEEKFTIGEIEIGYFTKEEIQNYYHQYSQLKPDTSFEQFTSIYKDNFEGIYAHLSVKAVPGRAEEIAKRKAEDAVDVLKCFCAKYSLQPHMQIFDLDYRLQPDNAGLIMRLINGKIENSGLLIRNRYRMVPLELTSSMMAEFSMLGIEEFSEFIKDDKTTNLSEAIRIGISQLASIVSTHNRYDKIVKAISLIESLCISKENPGRAKGETRVRKLIPQIISNPKDVQEITLAFTKAYRIRDKYLHNHVRLPVDVKILFFLMEFERAVLLKFIRLSKRLTSISEVHQLFGLQ